MAILRCTCNHSLVDHQLQSLDGYCRFLGCRCQEFELDEGQFEPRQRRLRDYEGLMEERDDESD